jgi:ABC-type transporter Mla MlaB component
MAIESVDDEKTILVTGPITIYEVSTVRETLRAALDEGKPLRIDLSDSGPWDVAGLQLLISCVKTGRDRNQVVHLRNLPRACVEMAERSGLIEWLHAVAG